MIPKIWRLSENSGDDNLGLACTEQGLMLGRTALIERRDGRFAVRERAEIERLLSRAYRKQLPVDRIMSGLATVTAALNANDQALARIAAVHLRIPDLPDHTARNEMEAEDVLIKYVRQREISHEIRKASLTIRSIQGGRPARRADVAGNFVRRTVRKRSLRRTS
jgi:hypothetical protein